MRLLTLKPADWGVAQCAGSHSAAHRCALLRDCFDPATHIHLAGPTAIDDARRVCRNTFRHVGVGRDFGNKGHYLAVLRAADPNILLEPGVDLAIAVARLMVGRIEIVVPIDI